VRPAEQPAGQQHERCEDPDELDRQQPDSQTHPAVGKQADPDEALQHGDGDESHRPGHGVERQQADRLDRQVLRIIALVVVGPKKLPAMGRSVGKGMREFKESLTGDSRDESPALTAASADRQKTAA
jgi:sec-independent protein translocase protein TatA